MENSQKSSTEPHQRKKKKGKKVRFGPLTGILRRSSARPQPLAPPDPSSRRFSADDTSSPRAKELRTLGGSLVQNGREVFSDDESVIEEYQSDPNALVAVVCSVETEEECVDTNDSSDDDKKKWSPNYENDPPEPVTIKPPGDPTVDVPDEREACGLHKLSLKSSHQPATCTELFVHGNAWIEKTLATKNIAFPHVFGMPDIPMSGYTKLWIDGENHNLMMLSSEGKQTSIVGCACEKRHPHSDANQMTLALDVDNAERIAVGYAVGIAPMTGLAMKGYAAYLDCDLLNQISDPVTEKILGVTGVQPGMTSGHDVAAIDDNLAAWLLTDTSNVSTYQEIAGKTHLVLGVLGSSGDVRISGAPYPINLGEPVTEPVIRSLRRRSDGMDVHYLLIWFECIRETKNKVEVLRVDYDRNEVPLVRTVFGPAKAAGPSAADGRIALIDENRAAFIRRRNRTIEIVPADISKLPVIIMGIPVPILEDRIPDVSGLYSATGVLGIQTVDREPVSALSNLVVVAPTLSNVGCHRVTVVEGRIALNGPLYQRGQESIAAVLPEDVSPVSSVENLTPDIVAIVHNCASGLGVSCMTVNPLKMMAHTMSRPILIHPKQATVIRSACIPAEHRVVISHVNGTDVDKKKGLVHVLDGRDIENQRPRVLISATPWTHTQSSSHFSVSAANSGGAFYISSDKGLQKGTIINDALVSFTAGRLPLGPIGVIKEVKEDESSVVVTRAGRFERKPGTFVPGVQYYAHADGTVSASKHSRDHSLYPEAVPIGIALSDSDLWIEVGSSKW